MSTMKALLIVVNAGFAEEIVEITRRIGARGATILNARGEGPLHKTIMGITIDSEKEMILSVVDAEMVTPILDTVVDEAGIGTPAHGVCFVLPVENMTGTLASMAAKEPESES